MPQGAPCNFCLRGTEALPLERLLDINLSWENCRCSYRLCLCFISLLVIPSGPLATAPLGVVVVRTAPSSRRIWQQENTVRDTQLDDPLTFFVSKFLCVPGTSPFDNITPPCNGWDMYTRPWVRTGKIRLKMYCYYCDGHATKRLRENNSQRRPSPVSSVYVCQRTFCWELQSVAATLESRRSS